MKYPILALLTLFLLSATALSQTGGYSLADSIVVGGEGGWDYLLVDTVMNRLYASHGTQAEVIDLAAKKVVGAIPNTNGIHGIAVAHEFNKGFTSNGRDSSVTVFDLKTLAVTATIKLKVRNPDAITYDPATKRVFTFNGGSRSATAIDAATNAVAGDVALSGKPEFAQPDGAGHIFVNIEDKSEVTEFDAQTLDVLATWPIAPGEEPSGLAFDREHKRLFSVCGNKLMVVSDARAHKVIASLPIGGRVDGAAFDPATGTAFSSNGEGSITAVREVTPDSFVVAGTVPTMPGARTIALDGRTHRLYLPTAGFGPAPAPTADRPRPRPSILPGSFKILVVSPQ